MFPVTLDKPPLRGRRHALPERVACEEHYAAEAEEDSFVECLLLPRLCGNIARNLHRESSVNGDFYSENLPTISALPTVQFIFFKAAVVSKGVTSQAFAQTDPEGTFYFLKTATPLFEPD